MVYSIMQVLAAEGSTIGEVPRKASPGGKVWHPTGLLPSVQAMSTFRGPFKQAFGVHPTEASDTGLTHRKYEDLKRYVQGVNCVAVGEIGLDHVRVRQDKGRDQQVFSWVCRLAKEVGKPVVIHCRGTASTSKECLWIMKSNLQKDKMVYWHRFLEEQGESGICVCVLVAVVWVVMGVGVGG